jgi:four helix bundle protein
MGNFTELKVWQRSKKLAVDIYKLTNQGSFIKDFGLRDQLRRASVSIPSNIAEGDELRTNKQSIQFFFVSKGSVAELLTQILIAFEIGYLKQEDYLRIRDDCQAISSMLTRLIQIRSQK